MAKRHSWKAIWRYWKSALRGSARYDHAVLAVLAVAVGIVVAYATILFRLAILGAQALGFGVGSEIMVEHVRALPWWQVVLVPTAGGLVVAVLLRTIMPTGRTHGVAEVIEANALADGRLSLRAGVTSALTVATALGTGSSSGREGPAVHLGATLASWIAQKLHLVPGVARTLLGCGVAAAVAASFNAPIAGVFFALEVVMGHYALHAFAPIVIASVTATIVSRIHLGDFPAFIVPDYAIVSAWEFPAFVLLGVLTAGVAVIFMRAILTVEDAAGRLPLPRWALPPIAGLIVGVIALAVPEVLGVGYEATDNALKQNYGLAFLIVLVVAKTAATAICLGCRYGGGVFSPAIYLGATTGGAFGLIAASLFPDLASGAGVYAIVGMGAVASAVLGAPISTILIVFELTGDYSITIAVMIAAAIASLITGLFFKSSFFYLQLERRGLSLEGGRVRYLLKARQVRGLMMRGVVTLRPEALLGEVKALLLTVPTGKIPVTDARGELVGVICHSEIGPEHLHADADETLPAGEIARANPLHVTAGESLDHALGLFESSGEDFLPVVNDSRNRIFVGMLNRLDVLEAYNNALVAVQAEGTTTRVETR